MYDEPNNRGLVLGSIVGALAVLWFIITLMPRTDPSDWGATLAMGVIGPVGGIILWILAATAHDRATRTQTKVIAWIGIAFSIASIISALTLWTL